MKKEKKAINVKSIIKTTKTLGDDLTHSFYTNKDLKVAGLAIASYRTAISAAKAQLIYKKLTGTPAEMEFFK
jgi:hypothetical protein